MTRGKAVWFALVSIVISLAGILVLGEVLLRFLPVARNPLVVPVTADNPIFHYTPNRTFLFSRDWDLHLVNPGRVNNAGMVNDQQYQSNGSTPLIAVIGDSFIEAMMVPYPETLQGRLANAMTGRLGFYSFAASGAPLSQYLIWGRYAVRNYGAKALIINLVGNDFDESHDAFKRDFPGFWIYVPDAGGELRLQLFDFRVGTIRSLIKHSSLARYFFLNLRAKYILSDWQRFRTAISGGSPTEDASFSGNTAAVADSARMRASILAIEAFFRDLPELVGLPAERILFTMDGFRYPEEARNGAGTYFDQIRREFRRRAEALGYEVIDAEPLFLAHFRQHGQRFEDSRDRHWNGTAHGIVADAVMRSRLLARFPFQPQANSVLRPAQPGE